eukprot:COSAG01_NODE_68273_length_264_cov_1.242424_1_plen_28_part_10
MRSTSNHFIIYAVMMKSTAVNKHPANSD